MTMRATANFGQIIEGEPSVMFEDLDANLQLIFFEASKNVMEADDALTTNTSGGRGNGSKRSGFLVDKMFSPKDFDRDITIRRKWE